MRVGNVFGHVCLSVCIVCLSVCVSVCLSVCLSVFLPVQAITFEPLNIETSVLVCRYILTISRLSLSIKVIGSKLQNSYGAIMIVYLFQLVNPLYVAKVTHLITSRSSH